jgi:hypothetical protein
LLAKKTEQHQSMLNNYQLLHAKQDQLLSRFLNAHADSLANVVPQEGEYQELIDKQRKLLGEHNETIETHAAFLQNMKAIY